MDGLTKRFFFLNYKGLFSEPGTYRQTKSVNSQDQLEKL